MSLNDILIVIIYVLSGALLLISGISLGISWRNSR